MASIAELDAYISSLPADTRRLGHTEWGVTIDSDPAERGRLDVGVRIQDDLLCAQAFVCAASRVEDPWQFLHFNRQTQLVRFASTRSGDIWIHAELPAATADAASVDRLLGSLYEAAVAARTGAGEAA